MIAAEQARQAAHRREQLIAYAVIAGTLTAGLAVMAGVIILLDWLTVMVVGPDIEPAVSPLVVVGFVVLLVMAQRRW